MRPVVFLSLGLVVSAAAHASVLVPDEYRMLNGNSGFNRYIDSNYAPDAFNNRLNDSAPLVGGTGKLCDGDLGTNDIFDNNSASWMGYRGRDELVQYFYTSPVSVDSVRVYAANFSSLFGDVGIPRAALVQMFDLSDNPVTPVVTFVPTAAQLASPESGWLDLYTGPTVTNVHSISVYLFASDIKPWMFISEVQVNGVPAPSAAGILGVAGLAAARRRR